MYDLGDIPALSVTTRNALNVPENAGTVKITITAPDGTVAVNAATVTGTAGVYVYNSYTPTMAGRYIVKWDATGANASASGDVFIVRESPNLALISLQDAKEHLNMVSTADDEELRRMLGGASSVIEALVGPIARQTCTDVVTGSGYTINLTRTPVISITSITAQLAGSPTIDVADLIVNPSGVVHRLSRAGFYDLPYAVVYAAGYAGAIPSRFIEATLVQLGHMWETQRGGGVRVPGIGASGDEAGAWHDQSHVDPRVHEILLRDMAGGFA